MCHASTLGESGVGCPHPPRRFTRVIYLEICTALKVTRPMVEGCRMTWPAEADIPAASRPALDAVKSRL